MRIVLYFLLTLAIGFATFWFYGHPVKVSFEGFNYHITTSLNVVIIGVLISSFLLRFLYGVLHWIFFVPVRLQEAWKGHKSLQDQKNFVSFFLNVMNHEVQGALADAEKVKGYHNEDPVFIYLFGRALLKSGKTQEAQLFFESVIQNPNLKLIGLSGLAYLKLQEKDLLGERATLETLLELQPQSIWILRRLYENLKTSQDIKKAKELLSRLEDKGYLEEAQTKTEWAHLYFLEAQSSQLSDTEKGKRLRQAHFLNPNSNEIAMNLAEALKKTGKVRQALDVMTTTWNSDPSQKLGDAYVRLLGNMSPLEIYENLKKLCQKNSQHPESLLLLTRYALFAKLWGEAKEHLLTLLQINPSLEVYQLLAQLEIEGYNQKDQAYEWLKKGLEVAA
ncbi:Tetratricopeptide repeat protein [Candidatus Bealeia paramacronuclearis]|uniref:Tetratricopeptide repeat protein n=1 Tax=Candidatus Bealeia paramacronuclearis TaxID=1921001 RepID=A0ABZ2C0Y2_9PROT|nr:Tetratricopeptide repeat protein [Candidatus Bealeia paramacronuclearis]